MEEENPPRPSASSHSSSSAFSPVSGPGMNTVGSGRPRPMARSSGCSDRGWGHGGVLDSVAVPAGARPSGGVYPGVRPRSRSGWPGRGHGCFPGEAMFAIKDVPPGTHQSRSRCAPRGCAPGYTMFAIKVARTAPRTLSRRALERPGFQRSRGRGRVDVGAILGGCPLVSALSARSNHPPDDPSLALPARWAPLRSHRALRFAPRSGAGPPFGPRSRRPPGCAPGDSNVRNKECSPGDTPEPVPVRPRGCAPGYTMFAIRVARWDLRERSAVGAFERPGFQRSGGRGHGCRGCGGFAMTWARSSGGAPSSRRSALARIIRRTIHRSLFRRDGPAPRLRPSDRTPGQADLHRVRVDRMCTRGSKFACTRGHHVRNKVARRPRTSRGRSSGPGQRSAGG